MYTFVDNPDIAHLTTFGLPAKCRRLVIYDDPKADLPELRAQGVLQGALVLGGGSNLLFTGDRDDLTVVHQAGGEPDIFLNTEDVVVMKYPASYTLDGVCAAAAEAGLWGIENLSGIPGTLGGATVQNAGAYGVEWKDVVSLVECYRVGDGRFITLQSEDCRYGYRDSLFKHLPEGEQLIVTAVYLTLYRSARPRLGYKGLVDTLSANGAADPAKLTPQAVRDAVLALRDSKLPRPSEAGSAGSFFKNPVVSARELAEIERKYGAPVNHHLLPDGSAKLAAAWLIDKAGCKSMTEGNAILWPAQPLVIANIDGRATGADVVRLEKRIIERVSQVFGVNLTPEVIHI